MPKKANRTKTGYKNIYCNRNTGKYDMKFNYKEYSVREGRNIYRSKGVYNLDSLAQAKLQLAELCTQGVRPGGKALSLGGAFELWKKKALSQNYSPVTIENTANYMRVIYRFIPADTLLQHIDEDACARARRALSAAAARAPCGRRPAGGKAVFRHLPIGKRRREARLRARGPFAGFVPRFPAPVCQAQDKDFLPAVFE